MILQDYKRKSCSKNVTIVQIKNRENSAFVKVKIFWKFNFLLILCIHNCAFDKIRTCKQYLHESHCFVA